MAGQAATIADRVVSAINAKGDYSNSFTPGAVRKFFVNAKKNREDVTSLLCFVVPDSLAMKPENAGSFDEDYKVRVFIFDKISKSDNSDDFDETEIVNRLTLVEEIQTQVIQYSDANPATLRTVGQVENNPIIDNEFMESGIFMSMTEFTLKNFRSV